MQPPSDHPPLLDRADVRIDKQERAWDGRFKLDLVTFRQRRFDGTMSGPRTWELWRRGRAAAVLPYDPVSDRVVLIEQFRLPALACGVDPVMVEIPAGLCDGRETAEATIRREAREEMGLDVDRLERIGGFVLSPGGVDERCDIFAGQVTAPEPGPDGLLGTFGLAAEQEDIRVRIWPAETAIARVLEGDFPNSVTAIALLWLASRRNWLRAAWLDPAGPRDMQAHPAASR